MEKFQRLLLGMAGLSLLVFLFALAVPAIRPELAAARGYQDSGSFITHVFQTLHDNWQAPESWRTPEARNRPPVMLSLRVDADGRVLSYSVHGDPADLEAAAAALETLRKSAPFTGFEPEPVSEAVDFQFMFLPESVIMKPYTGDDEGRPVVFEPELPQVCPPRLEALGRAGSSGNPVRILNKDARPVLSPVKEAVEGSGNP